MSEGTCECGVSMGVIATWTHDEHMDYHDPFKVGRGVTIVHWSDRWACTVIEATAKTVTVQRDKAIRTDDHGMSDSQSYRYEPDPDGSVRKFSLRKTGKFVQVGDSINGTRLVRGRSEHYDYSF